MVHYLGTIIDSNGLTRVIDPDERNVLVCETVSSRRYANHCYVIALWATLSRCHSPRSLIGSQPILRMSQFLSVPSDDKTCRGDLDTFARGAEFFFVSSN